MSVIDGAMSKYPASSVRVLHLLKNPTRSSGETGHKSFASLVDSVSENPGRGLLGQVAQRSWAIQSRTCGYALAYAADPAALGAALQSSAIVNLSDAEISKTTNSRKVQEWSRRSDWQRRVEALVPKPHVVICGGWDVFRAAKKILARDQTVQNVEGVEVFCWSGIPFLRACHPSARYARRRFAAEHERMVSAALTLVPK